MKTEMLQSLVKGSFEGAFSRTPLRQRLEDVLGEAIELSRYTDLDNLKEEAGDLLASAIQLCNESGWKIEDLVLSTLDKIEKRKPQYLSLGRKTKVALIGGAFDPPTIGHVKLAQFVLDTSKTFDEAWLVPCFSHMHGKKMAPAEHRIAMCLASVVGDARIKVFDYEISNKLSGETYHFVKKLLSDSALTNQYDFSCVIGSDNANSFDRWVNYQDLERMIRFVVVCRKGFDIDLSSKWFLNPPHILLVQDKVEIPQTSSTEARDILQSGDFSNPRLSELLAKSVLGYIKEHGLYAG